MSEKFEIKKAKANEEKNTEDSKRSNLEDFHRLSSQAKRNRGASILDSIKAINNRVEKKNIFLELSRKDYRGCSVLKNAKTAYGDNMEMFRIFAEVAKENYYYCEALTAAKAVYGDNIEKPKEVRDLIWPLNSSACEALTAAKTAYGDNMEMFRIFAEVAKENSSACEALTAAKTAYGDNMEMFRIFAELAKENYFACYALTAAKAVYGDNVAKIEAVRDLIQLLNSSACEALTAAKTAYGDNMERFRIFAEVAKKNSSACETLTAAKTAYGDSMEMFRIFAEVAKKNSSACYALTIVQDAYGDNMEMFRIFAEVAKKNYYFCGALTAAKAVYGDNIEKLKEVRDLIWPLNSDACYALTAAKTAYGDNMEMFKIFAEVAKHSSDSCRALAAAKAVYGDNIEKLKEVRDLIWPLNSSACGALTATKTDYGDNMEMFRIFAEVAKENSDACYTLTTVQDAYSDSMEMLRIFAELAKKDSNACHVLAAAKTAYGDNMEMFKIFAQVAKHSSDSCRALVAAKAAYGDNMEMFKIFAEVAKHSSDSCRALAAAKAVYGDNMEMFKIFTELAKKNPNDCVIIAALKDAYDKDLEKLKIILTTLKLNFEPDVPVAKKYMEIYQKGSPEAAKEYIQSLKEKSKALIGSDFPPAEIREMPEYMTILKYVYPKGNYSNHDNNLQCGDHFEDLAGYKFDKAGYPIELTGLLGYTLKAGEQENPELLKQYQERLMRIRDFVSSRGPDNVALQEEFDKKVASFFSASTQEIFKKIKDLNSREQLLCLMLSEAYRKGKSKNNFKPNNEILDLIVEYKYAYQEDLTAYIQRSADAVKTFKDQTSQNRALWNELSTIYGENLKHVLRHDIFDYFSEESIHRDEIEEAFGSLFGVKAETSDLKPKQWENLSNTFENTKIPTEKRAGNLLRQLATIFGVNIKFETAEAKQEFQDRLQDIVQELESSNQFTLEGIRTKLPELFRLRAEYRFNINSQIESVFSSDINTIFRELAKYDENIEVEQKENRMNGPKDEAVKKSKKTRQLTSYFTKTRESANARMGAYLCIAGDNNMYANKNYFELVSQEKETNKCAGLVMFLNIEAEDGKKYLWFGPNPFESLLDQVSSVQVYDYYYNLACQFAKENGYDGVVVPSRDEQILGHCTSRGGDFPDLIKASRLRDKKGNLNIVQFGKKHILGGGYGYEDGALIWERI